MGATLRGKRADAIDAGPAEATPQRRMDAFCDVCQDVRSCRMQPGDPGSCACVVCGNVILLMKPLGSPDSLPAA